MRIKVSVKAGARREAVLEVAPDRFEITVREEAAGNMANTRVREILALRFRVPLTKVRIIKGHRSTVKMLEIVS